MANILLYLARYGTLSMQPIEESVQKNKLLTQMSMKTNYEAPQIEVIDVTIEKGFADSNPIDDMPYGTNNWQ